MANRYAKTFSGLKWYVLKQFGAPGSPNSTFYNSWALLVHQTVRFTIVGRLPWGHRCNTWRIGMPKLSRPPNVTFYNSWALWVHQTLFLKQCVLESLHRETKRNRYICPCTRIRIYVFADERALCRAPFSFWPAFSFRSASMAI